MSRNYAKTQRAASEESTRQRIVEATIELHESQGGDATTVSAIARRAGVGRVTVYRHFPDELALLGACTGLYLRRNPVPDLAGWHAETDPFRRLERGLRETYAYHRRTQKMMSVAERDVASNPTLATLLEPMLEYWRSAKNALAEGLHGSDAVRPTTKATISLALALSTWKLLTEDGLDDEDCVELFVETIRGQLSGAGTDAPVPPPTAPPPSNPRSLRYGRRDGVPRSHAGE